MNAFIPVRHLVLRIARRPGLLLALATTALAVIHGCASAEAPNPDGGGTTNNGTANNGGQNNGQNNGTANNGTANNGGQNNGTANNGGPNNGTANNGTANNGTIPQAPVIETFTVDREAVRAGESVTLTWAVTRAASVSISASTGEAPGNVEATGSAEVVVDDDVSFTLEATNVAGTVQAVVDVAVASPLVITAPAEGVVLPAGEAGLPWTYTVMATGGREPLVYGTQGSLPPGLSIDAGTGVISGTPTLRGNYNVVLRVRDSLDPPQEVTRETMLDIAAEAPTILTMSLPDGQVGEPYLTNLAARGGITPLSWTASNLPIGLTIAADGTLAGTPTAHGQFDIAFTVTDGGGRSRSTTLPLRVRPLELVVATDALPNGRIDEVYQASVEATGGIPPYSFAFVGLPAGLTGSGSGELTGTPTVAGTSDVTVTVSDSGGASAERGLTLTILDAAPVITTTTLPDGQVDVAYSATVTAVGGVPPYTFAVASGALPGGLSLSGGGVLSGTPTQHGAFDFTVSVGDATDTFSTRALRVNVAPRPLSIETASVPDADLGQPWSATITGNGGVTPYTWSVEGALPAGVTWTNAANALSLSGSPTQTGTFSFDAVLTDSAAPAAQARRSYTFQVVAEPLVITTGSLPSGQVSVAYDTTLQATGGVGARTWGVSGALPAGLTLDGATGRLSGTPTLAGSFSVTVSVTDGATTTDQTFSLTIAPAPVVQQHHMLVGSYTDIAAGGAPPVGALSDDGTMVIDLPFAFVLYGESFTSFTLSANGALNFSPNGYVSSSNASLPAIGGNRVVAPFWDDLTPNEEGSVHFEVQGVAPFRRAIAQWKDVSRYADVTNRARINAEVILYESTNQIQFLYGHSLTGDADDFANTGSSATIGIQNGDGSDAVEIAYLQAGSAAPGQVYLLTPEGTGYTLDGWDAVDGDFLNIASTGTQLTSVSGDDTKQLVDIGFTFPFYGSTYTQVWVSSNGFMTFAAYTVSGYDNVNIPAAASLPGGVIAPLWDDLVPDTGRIYMQVLGAAPRRQLVVQWSAFRRLADINSRLTFEVVLYETSGDIAFHYGDITFGSRSYDFGKEATMGIQSQDATTGVNLSYNQPNLRPGASAYFSPKQNDDRTTYTGVGLSTHFIDLRPVSGASRVLTASATMLDGSDDGTATLTLPFPVTFYGQTFDRLSVCTNGWAAFGDVTTANAYNEAMPNASTPNALLAPLWDDHDPTFAARGQIWSHTLGTAPNRQFVVQWQNLPAFGTTARERTFELVISESGEIVYNYGPFIPANLTDTVASSVTVGVESPDGSAGDMLGRDRAGIVRAGGHARVIDPGQ